MKVKLSTSDLQKVYDGMCLYDQLKRRPAIVGIIEDGVLTIDDILLPQKADLGLSSTWQQLKAIQKGKEYGVINYTDKGAEFELHGATDYNFIIPYKKFLP